MPGTASKDLPIFSANSGNDLAEVHSFCFQNDHHIAGFHRHRVGGHFTTSDFCYYFFHFRILWFQNMSSFWVYSMVVFKLLPVKTLVSTAKSPSSNEGINSPPNLEKDKYRNYKSTATEAMTVLGKMNCFQQPLMCVGNFIHHSVRQIGFVFQFLLNTKALIIGI